LPPVVLAIVISWMAILAWTLRARVRAAVSAPARLRRWNVRRALAVAQLIIAVAFSVLGCRLALGFGRLWTLDPGFNPHRLLTASLVAPLDKVGTPAVDDAMRSVLAAVRGEPGVVAATTASTVPLGPGSYTVPIRATADDGRGTRDLPMQAQWVQPAFFDVMGIAWIEGRRTVLADDRVAGVVVNERARAQLWPGESSVVGRSVLVFGQHQPVIGVARNVIDHRLWLEARPQVFVVSRDNIGPSLLIRTTGSTAEFARRLTAVVGRVAPDLRPAFVQSVDDIYWNQTTPHRTRALFLNLLGLTAVLVSVVGFGIVLQHFVETRRREWAIKIALGADAWVLRRDIAGGALAVGATSAAAGLLLGHVAAKVVGTLVTGVDQAPLWSTAAVGVGALTVSAVLGLLAARYATSVVPTEALRES
jgi:hypothetical protein